MTVNTNPQSVEIEDLCNQLVKTAKVLVDCKNDNRKEIRNTLTLPCQVVPIDNNLKPTDKPFSAITTDISSNGISILHTECIEPQLIQVTVVKTPTHTIQLLADLVRCGSVNGYYKIGAKLIQKAN